MLPSFTKLCLQTVSDVGAGPVPTMRQFVLYSMLQNIVGGTTSDERVQIRSFLRWLYTQPEFEKYVPAVSLWLRSMNSSNGLTSAIQVLGFRKKRRLEAPGQDTTVRETSTSLILNSDMFEGRGPWIVNLYYDANGRYRIVLNPSATHAIFPSVLQAPLPSFETSAEAVNAIEDLFTMTSLALLFEWLMGQVGPVEAVATLKVWFSSFTERG